MRKILLKSNNIQVVITKRNHKYRVFHLNSLVHISKKRLYRMNYESLCRLHKMSNLKIYSGDLIKNGEIDRAYICPLCLDIYHHLFEDNFERK